MRAVAFLGHLLNAKQGLGLLFAAVGMAIPIYLAVAGSSDQPPPAATQGLLAFVSVCAQLASGWLFSRRGVVDPSHPKQALRRLELLRVRSSEARRLADFMVDEPRLSVADRQRVTGQISIYMSVLQEDVAEAMDDWYAAMPHAVDAAPDVQIGEV